MEGASFPSQAMAFLQMEAKRLGGLYIRRLHPAPRSVCFPQSSCLELGKEHVYSSSIYDKKVLWRRPSEWSAHSLYKPCGESSQAQPIFPINKSPGYEVLPRLFIRVNSRATTQFFLLQELLSFYWMLAVHLGLNNLGPWACLGLFVGSGRATDIPGVAAWSYFLYTLCLSKRGC